MACLCFLAATLTGQTQTLKIWNGSVGSDWAVAANWTPAAVPVAGDSVVIKFIENKPSPIIHAGTVAKAKNVNLGFTNLTVAVGGQLELSSSLNVTAFVMNGKLFNNGTITIKSGFWGILNQGELYNNGTLLLGDANATPYAFKEDAICMNSFFTNLALTNGSTGNIVIRRAGNNGILINDSDGYVVFTNHGQISISETGLSENPAVAATGDGIDLASGGGGFTNETSGVIQISKVSANGIYCRESNQCSNKGKIEMEDVGRTTALETREGILNKGIFTNYATGQISIDKASNNGILNTNTFTNSGAVSIGVLFPASIGNMGLANFAQSPIVEANFVNEPGASLTIRNVAKTGIITAGAFQPAEVSNKAGATISIDQTELHGVEVVGLAGFDNYGLLQIGLNGSIREYGIRNGFEFANQQTGEIVIQNTGEAAIYNAVSPIADVFLSKFRSAGRISIGQADQAGDVAVYNDGQGTFELLGCKALLHLTGNNVILNAGTFSNTGNIIENGSGNSSISTNSGVIQNLNGGNFAVTGSNTGAVATASGLLWTGCFDTNWNADYNWNTVAVPTATDVVVIPNVNNDPVIEAGVNAFAKSVQVLPDAALTIQEKLTLDGAEHYSLYNQGSVTNNGTVLIGQTTGGGAHGIRNAATFLNNTGAEIHIDRTASNANGIGIGLWNESGTFTNKAKIFLGNNAAIGVHGLYNNATFQNDLGGSIQIDRTTESALMNHNGVFNNADRIVIGSKGGSTYGLRNYAEFNNNAHGDISIDAAYNTGVRNDAGTFNNAAQLTIGAVYGVGENGILNYANFNHTAGEIRVDRSTFAGIRTSGGTFANAAKIVIGASASTGKSGIFIGSPFNNNAGGDIRIDRATQSGIEVNSNTFTNAAKITIGAGAGITGDGIHNQDNFYNIVGGEIKIDQTTNTGIFNEKYYPADPGNFVNAGKINIGATAGTGLHGIYNSGWFQNNNGGEMALDRSSQQGIKNAGGTFDNTGNITVGGLFSTGDYGVYNDAVFQNNTNAQISIARSVKEALHNHEGATFHNHAEIIIGAEHPAGDYGIFNFGAFNNHPEGGISIDRCVKSGLYNRQGTAVVFHNYARLVIGSKGSSGEHGIHNYETFENHEGGSIDIDSCTMSGLENVYGTFTNAALLRVGASSSTGPIGIVNLGTLENGSGGSIYINRSTQTGLNTISLFRNRGQAHIGDQMSIGNICLNNTGTVENLDGAIYLDRSSTQALLSVSSFTNAALLSVGNFGNIGNTGIDNRGFFDNTATGDIHIESYTVEGFYNRREAINSGQIIISGSGAANGYGLRNITSFKKFTNAACGVVRMSAPLFNLGAFENAGLISANTNTAHFNSTGLTNNGILEYPQGNPIPNVTNNGLVVQPFGGECVATPALSIGNNNPFVVGGTWYTDAGLSAAGGTFNQAANTFTVTNLPEGDTHTLFFNIHDAQNNCDRTLSVQFDYHDVTPPVLQCPANQTPLPSNASSCTALVSSGLQAGISDNCTGFSLSYALSGATSGSGNGSLGPTSFNSGQTTVVYAAVDGAGNGTNCQFTVSVAPCANGRIIWKQDNNTGVKDVTISVTGDYTTSSLTGANGMYGFVLPTGSNFTVTPSKNTNKLNGVNAQDVFRLQQHLNGNPLTNPWQLIAADANSNGAVNALDLSILQNSLLGNPSAQAQMVKSWRFVPTNHTMATPPWGFPEQIALSGVNGRQDNLNFYGLKVGDLVATYANPANTAGQPLVLRTRDEILHAGQTLAVEVTADALRDLTALQFALHFDPEYMQLSDIQTLTGLPLGKENFGTWQISEGSIRVLWSGAQSAALRTGAPLFRLQFAVLEGGSALSEVLRLDDETLPGQVFGSDGAASGVSLRFEGVTASSTPLAATDLQLQNHPNPFSRQTTLSFVLPDACEARLRIVDAAGRLVAERQKQYPAGPQTETFELALPPGVLYGELSTPFGVLTRKMVVVKE